MTTQNCLVDAWTLPQPNRLHWGWVLLLTLITGGLFSAIWLLVISQWVTRARGKSQAYGWAWAYVVVAALSSASDVLSLKSGEAFGGAALVLFLVVSFLLRGEMEANPIGLNLSGVMTLFFGPIYFQYHLQRFGDRSFERPGSMYNV